MSGTVRDLWKDPSGAWTERRNKGKRWQARWREPDGTQRALALHSKAEAHQYLAAMAADKNAGRYVTPEAGAITLEEYAGEWVPRQLHHAPSTTRLVESRLRLHILPALGAHRLRDLTHAHVQDFVVQAQTHLAPSYVRVLHAHLQNILGDAARDRRVSENVARGVNLPRMEASQVLPLTPTQLAGLHATVLPRVRPLVTLAAGSGLRIGEILGLTWDRLDGNVLRVDRQLLPCWGNTPIWGPPKTRASKRSVQLDPLTMGILERHREEHGVGPRGLMWANAFGDIFNHNAAAMAWRRASAKLGTLPTPGGWHDLRHYHVSVLISEGMSMRYVMERLGHANMGTTLNTYAHLMPMEDSRAANIMGKNLSAWHLTE